VIRTTADVAALIRDRRHKLGLDQGALAKRVGVGREWIIEIEKGKPRAGIELVLRTLAALGVVLTAQRGDKPRKSPDIDLDAIVDSARRTRK
jgi:HTH-type transcriptional regulator/antitoxin HipB